MVGSSTAWGVKRLEIIVLRGGTCCRRSNCAVQASCWYGTVRFQGLMIPVVGTAAHVYAVSPGRN